MRTVQLARPLKPMVLVCVCANPGMYPGPFMTHHPHPRILFAQALHLSAWTTANGWPGLIRWGGETDWKARPAGESDDVPIEAIFKVTSFPNEA